MATKELDMLVLDDEGLKALAGVLWELPQIMDLFARIAGNASDEASQKATLMWKERIEDAATAMAATIQRCNSDYAWMTDQINPDKPTVPTVR